MTLLACRHRGRGVRTAGPCPPPFHISWVVLLLACSGTVEPPAAPPTGVGARDSVPAAGAPAAEPHGVAAQSKPLLADTPRVTAGGVRYIAPSGWTSSMKGAVTVLTAQEGDSHVAILESSAAEPDAAWPKPGRCIVRRPLRR